MRAGSLECFTETLDGTELRLVSPVESGNTNGDTFVVLIVTLTCHSSFIHLSLSLSLSLFLSFLLTQPVKADGRPP